jgi:hypothetical protein
MARKIKKPAHGSGNRKTSSDDRKNAGGKDGNEQDDDPDADEEEQDENEEQEEDDESGSGEGKDGKGKPKPRQDDDGEGEEEEDELDLDALPPKAQKYIKGLRKENAKYRTSRNKHKQDYEDLAARLKGIADGDENALTPEEAAEVLSQENGSLAFSNQVLRVAVANGISGEDELEYFEFLIGKEVSKLDEGEELDEDAIGELVAKVRKKHGGGSASTSFSADKSKQNGKKKPEGNDGKITLDDFVNMTMVQKSELYRKDKDTYEKLVAQAKQKRRLVR